jgi:hypothetical protein
MVAQNDFVQWSMSETGDWEFIIEVLLKTIFTVYDITIEVQYNPEL